MKKSILVLVVFLMVAATAFGQTRGEYVSVLVQSRGGQFSFFFSESGFSLSLDRNLDFVNLHIPLAVLSNYMRENGYEFVQFLQQEGSATNTWVLFRRRT